MPISPARWGAVVWDSLHYFTLGYPEADPSPVVRQAALDMMASLVHLLPCQLCRQHLADAYRRDMPLTPAVAASREAFGSYVVALRDFVKRKHVDGHADAPRHRFPEDVEGRLLGARAEPTRDWTGVGFAIAFIATFLGLGARR